MAEVSIAIDVKDLGQAVAFYEGALGCTRVKDMGEKMTVLSAGNASIYLMEKEAGSSPLSGGHAERNFERHWTPVHLDFLTDDVSGTISRVTALGGTHEGGEKGDWGEIAHCADPFGNGFCVINE